MQVAQCSLALSVEVRPQLVSSYRNLKTAAMKMGTAALAAVKVTPEAVFDKNISAF